MRWKEMRNPHKKQILFVFHACGGGYVSETDGLLYFSFLFQENGHVKTNGDVST